MFEYEWALFVRVALYASLIYANGKLGLFRFKAAMSVVAVRALHRSFQHSVMERLCELRFLLIVTAQAKLGFTLLQHFR
jgi:hypothetical protein